MGKVKKKGRIIIPAGANPWPHELRVAKILAQTGFSVEFIQESRIRTPDIRLDGIEFEIKSPLSNKTDKIERNIKRALKQSRNIIIDSSRIEGIDDRIIRNFLSKKAKEQKQIKKLIFVTKRGKIVVLK